MTDPKRHPQQPREDGFTDSDFSRRPTSPSMTASRDPRQTIQPTGEHRAPRPPDTPAETPDSKQRSSQRTAMPTNLDLMQAFNSGFGRLASELGDVKREQRDHGQRIEALEKKRSLSPVPALGAVGMASPPVAHPGNPGDVLVPVPARVPSMTGDPKVDAERLRALEPDAGEDSLRYRSLAAETAEQNRRIALLESAVRAQPAAAKEAAKVVADTAAAKAEEQTTALERMLTNRTFTNFVYTVVALFVGLVAQTLASRALTKDAAAEGAKQGAEVGAKAGAKEAAADRKPEVIIVRPKEESP